MMAYTTDLTVPQFDLLEQFLPQSRTFKSIISRHRIVNAIFYQLKNGCQRRASAGGFSQLAKRLSAVQRRQLDGTWEKVLAALALAERKTVKKRISKFVDRRLDVRQKHGYGGHQNNNLSAASENLAAFFCENQTLMKRFVLKYAGKMNYVSEENFMPQNSLVELPNDFDELVENLVTEDDEPVENLVSDKQMRLLVEPLYSSWKPLTDEEVPQPRNFLAAADVGIFTTPYQSSIVPDVLLSLDVEPRGNFFEKKNRSYFVWEFGKVPEVPVEIVSNKKGDETDGKMNRYAKMAVSYYVVFDPLQALSDDVLRVYELGFGGRRYHLRRDDELPDVGLALTLWSGEFEEEQFEWLRWCDADGNLILSGKERAEKAEKKLHELGIDPDQL